MDNFTGLMCSQLSKMGLKLSDLYHLMSLGLSIFEGSHSFCSGVTFNCPSVMSRTVL